MTVWGKWEDYHCLHVISNLIRVVLTCEPMSQFCVYFLLVVVSLAISTGATDFRQGSSPTPVMC